jgi:hypothetical protein
MSYLFMVWKIFVRVKVSESFPALGEGLASELEDKVARSKLSVGIPFI